MSFPVDSWVEVRYPLTSEQEHADLAARFEELAQTVADALDAAASRGPA